MIPARQSSPFLPHPFVGFRLCAYALLPTFDGEPELKKWNEKILGDHPTPVLAKWKCRHCGCLHVWNSGAATDSNGQFKAGNDKIPTHVQELINDSK